MLGEMGGKRFLVLGAQSLEVKAELRAACPCAEPAPAYSLLELLRLLLQAWLLP